MQTTYPDQLLGLVKELWQKQPQQAEPLPPDGQLQVLFDQAFHASLHSEEGRALTFRIAYCRPEDLRRDASPLRRNTPLPLRGPRRLTVSEMVRIAPAANPHQLLIGIYLNEARELEIWGLIDSGLYWWGYERGERYRFLSGMPPECLTVSSFQQGSLTISRGGATLVQLRHGRLLPPISPSFSGDAFGNYVRVIGEELYRQTRERLAAAGDDGAHLDLDFVRQFLMSILQRILWRVQAARHGGTILILPDDWSPDNPAWQEVVQVKYLLDDPGSWPLLVGAMFLNSRSGAREGRVAASAAEQQALRQQFDDAADLVLDRISLIASLATIDGAVVLDRRLRILGFGAELLARSPELTEVLTPDAVEQRAPIEEFGTRHRSAVRFCYQQDQAIAFIVSQDGDIRIALRVGDGVILRHAENLLNTPGIYS